MPKNIESLDNVLYTELEWDLTIQNSTKIEDFNKILKKDRFFSDLLHEYG